MDNLTIILNQFEQLKGQYIITQTWTVERLVAIGTDTEDYYYLTWNGREITWHSCVGRIIPLKGYLREEDYNDIVSIAKLNAYEQQYGTVAWQEEWNKRRMLWGPDHSLLTLIYWDIN